MTIFVNMKRKKLEYLEMELLLSETLQDIELLKQQNDIKNT